MACYTESRKAPPMFSKSSLKRPDVTLLAGTGDKVDNIA